MISATMAWALEVECTPGNLSNLITDKSITTLSITGEMDARDFKFIRDELKDLLAIDLSNVNIVAVTTSTPLFASAMTHEANSIPEMAFFGNKIESVVLPANLKGIGMASFAGCEKLDSIKIPDELETIGSFAFSASGLKSVTLPNTMKYMGEGAFMRCKSMTQATVTPSNGMALSKDAFLDCSELKVAILGPGVSAIGDGAFAGCDKLNDLIYIGGSNVTTIGKAAFSSSGLESYDFTASRLLTDIDDWAFAGSKITDATMPVATKHVGKGAFYYAKDFSSFTPSAHVDTIGDYTFTGTAIANDDAIGTVATLIGDYAFYNTPATSLTIPATVKKIGTMAMAGMTDLQSLTSEAVTVPELGENVWMGVNQANIPLTVPDEAIEDYKNALQWQNFMITKPHIFGDVNQDGSVNASDVTALYNYILNGNETFIATSDVNGDGSINASDVTAVYNIIMGNSNAPRHPSSTPTSDKLSASDFTIDAGSTYPMAIILNNNTAYTAMQFDIELPQGLSINSVKSTSRTSNANIGFNEVENGKWRILATTANNETWSGKEGAIFTIEVKANEYFSGSENINIFDIIAVEPSENISLIDELTIGVSNTTGVKDINVTDDNGPVDVYNMHGQLLRQNVERSQATNGLPAGFYIVGGKKVLVK